MGVDGGQCRDLAGHPGRSNLARYLRFAVPAYIRLAPHCLEIAVVQFRQQLRLENALSMKVPSVCSTHNRCGLWMRLKYDSERFGPLLEKHDTSDGI